MFKAVTDDTVTLAFTLEGLAVTASLPVQPGYVPVDAWVGELALDRDLAEWLGGQDWFDTLVDDTVNLCLNNGIEAEINELLQAKALVTAMTLFKDRMFELTPEQRDRRLRFYRPELVSTTPDDSDYSVSPDLVAFNNRTATLQLPGLRTTLVPIAVRQWLPLMVEGEDRDTLTLDGLFSKVVANVNRFGVDGVRVGVWSVVAPWTDLAIRQLFPDLDSLEKLLGLVVDAKQRSDNLLLPTGEGPAAVSEGLAAAVGNHWTSDNDGVVSYSTLSREGLSVRLVVSEDGISPIAVATQALNAVATIDHLAAQLHQLLSDLTLRQPNPWVDRFWVSTDDILGRLSLGRLGLKAKSTQAAAVVKSLRGLSRVLVRLDWEDDPDYRRSYSDLWSVGYNESRELDPHTGLPTRYDLRVTPGAWAEMCLERVNGRRDVLWHGYAPAAIAKQSLAGQLLRYYHQTTDTRFTVYTWLVGSCSRTNVDQQLGNPKSKARLKSRFQKALSGILGTTLVDFDIDEHPRDWLNDQVVKRVLPVVPGPAVYTDLKRLRLSAGLTQAEVAAKAGYDRAYLSRIERYPGLYPEAARAVRDALTEKMHTTDVHGLDKP